MKLLMCKFDKYNKNLWNCEIKMWDEGFVLIWEYCIVGMIVSIVVVVMGLICISK